jgi:enterochelin esterase family protein
MRSLALILAACSCAPSSRPPSSVMTPAPAPPAVSSQAPTPTPTPSPAPAAAPTPPPAATDRLERGRPIERAIRAGEAHRYRFELAAGQAALGVVMQNGIDLELITFDLTGRKLAEVDSPNGSKGPEPFVIEATIAGAYDLLVRPLVEPPPPPGAAPPPPSPGAAPPPPPLQPTEGRYEVRLDEILSTDAYAERLAKDRIASPRLLEVWRAVRAKDAAAIAKFWSELKGKAPIVEPYPGEPRDVLVTFVMRATAPYVGMLGGPDFREKPLVRLEGSDLWYLSARMPADSRFDYSFIVDDGPPPYRLPYRKDRGPDPRFAKRQNDPNNPLARFGQSRVELPGAPPQPWIVAKPEVPKGKLAELKLKSAQLEETRRVGIYTPPGFEPKRRYPLLIVFDGEVYGLDSFTLIPVPTILDNLIAAKKIPPIVAALVANQGTRGRDLRGSAPFSAFIAKELVPKLRAEYRAGLSPAETIVAGSSFGGLCSAYTAFHHSDVIGNVLSQSGAYQYVLGALDSDLSPFVDGGWLIRDYAAVPRRPIRFYLDAGLFEADLLEINRRMRDVLVAKGYPLTYVEFSGGHDFGTWRGTIADGLIALLAAKR